MWECEKQERKKQYRLFAHATLRRRLGLLKRWYLGNTYIPSPLLPFMVDLYFMYYRISRKFFKTAKDRLYEYQTDSRGSILPSTLLVTPPQQFVPPEKLETLVKAPKDVVRITELKESAERAA